MDQPAQHRPGKWTSCSRNSVLQQCRRRKTNEIEDGEPDSKTGIKFALLLARRSPRRARMSKRTACSAQRGRTAPNLRPKARRPRARILPIERRRCCKDFEAMRMARLSLETKAYAPGGGEKARTMNERVDEREGERVAKARIRRRRVPLRKRRVLQAKMETQRISDRVARAMTANLDSCLHRRRLLCRHRLRSRKCGLEKTKRIKMAFLVSGLGGRPTVIVHTPNVVDCCWIAGYWHG
jgi:hypothetical protein